MGRGPQRAAGPWDGGQCARGTVKSALDRAVGRRDSALGPSPCGPAGALLRKQAAGSGQSQQRCSVTGRTGQEPSGQPPQEEPRCQQQHQGPGGPRRTRASGWGTHSHTDTHMNTHQHTRAHEYTDIHAYAHVDTYEHTDTQRYTCTQIHTHTYIHKDGHTHRDTHTCRHRDTHMHMRTQIYIHRHT